MQEMQEGVVLMNSQQRGFFLPLLMTLLAEAEAEAGRPEAGLTNVDRQLVAIERTGQRWCLSDLHRVRGEILLGCWPRNDAAAECAFMRAIDISRSQAARLFELKASLSLARLWHDQGKHTEAYDLLAPIYDWFTEGFDTRELLEAKALLAELA